MKSMIPFGWVMHIKMFTEVDLSEGYGDCNSLDKNNTFLIFPLLPCQSNSSKTIVKELVRN